ncbi:MAG: hypothetical protein PUE14_07795, partial [Clostridia bacterium]|nr:hypothetical protein [Clostridia bacterium]
MYRLYAQMTSNIQGKNSWKRARGAADVFVLFLSLVRLTASCKSAMISVIIEYHPKDDDEDGRDGRFQRAGGW